MMTKRRVRKVACFQKGEKNGILTENDLHSSITGEKEKVDIMKQLERQLIENAAVGERIRLIRMKHGLTAEEFGEFIDKATKSLVSRWENGISLPNRRRMELICRFGRITMEELLYGDVPTTARYHEMLAPAMLNRLTADAQNTVREILWSALEHLEGTNTEKTEE